MKAQKERSPLDRMSPLRTPGQSLTDEIDDLGYDHIIAPMIFALFMVMIAVLEWWRYVSNVKPSPWLFSFVAVLACIYAIVDVRRNRKKIRQLRLGRDGERAVAERLEWLRRLDFVVFHDVPNGDANVDHVLIGPQGIFTIETKTLSKPLRGECKVSVVDGVVRANGLVLERNPIVQAKAQAGWLRNFLAEAQFNVQVWPVVVFPGWFVEPFDFKATGAWVLEVKALAKFIESEPERHTRDEVKAMASALRSHVRAQPGK